MKHIILSPHFDDAVLSLGGYLSILKNQATVITFFTDSPTPPICINWTKKCGFLNTKEEMLCRKKENDSALKYLGNNMKDLCFVQSSFSKKKTKEEKIKLTNIILDKLISILENEKNFNIYGPCYLGQRTHKDHKIIHEVFIKLFDYYRKSDNSFYIYEDYPYCDSFRIKNDI